MSTLLSFLLRLFLIAVGLLFAASMALAFAFMLAVWGVRAAWYRLTGRPVMPFIIRIDPRRGFERMYRGTEAGSRRPRADSVQPRRKIVDVTDVEPKA
jgi:hypothetical protein